MKNICREVCNTQVNFDPPSLWHIYPYINKYLEVKYVHTKIKGNKQWTKKTEKPQNTWKFTWAQDLNHLVQYQISSAHVVSCELSSVQNIANNQKSRSIKNNKKEQQRYIQVHSWIFDKYVVQ